MRPDVVLMDVRMPELDGIAATRQIAADEHLCATRVVMLTTFDMDEYGYEALEAGASGFLLKDVEPDEAQSARPGAGGDLRLRVGSGERPAHLTYGEVVAKPVTVAVTVKVTGRVQGVSFRWYAAQEADRLGVAGWVRNEPDGSVAAQVEGDAAAVDAMVEWCRQGPSYASVRGVAVTEAHPTGARGFDIRH